MPDYSEGKCEYCQKPFLACNGKNDCTEYWVDNQEPTPQDEEDEDDFNSLIESYGI